jgi:predicted RNA-binding protein YlxR (DUF448 family)
MSGQTRKQNNQPQRTCLGCKTRDAQAAMIRLVTRPEGVVLAQLDNVNSAAGGRSGYLHKNASCLESFERSRVKEFRSLKRGIGPDERRAITKLIRKRLASGAGVE